MTKRRCRRIKSKQNNRAPVLTPLAAAVMTAIYPVGWAMAQDAEDPSAEAVEEIIVTGSRIRKDTFSTLFFGPCDEKQGGKSIRVVLLSPHKYKYYYLFEICLSV